MSFKSDPGYLAILAKCDGRVEPIGLWSPCELAEVMRRIRGFWPDASTIHVMWHGLGEKSKLTDSNCRTTLALLKQRNSKDVLIVTSEQKATKDSAEVPGREIMQNFLVDLE